MPALSVLTISAIVCAAFVTGLLLLPFLAHRMLIRKYRQVADCEPKLEKMSELGMIPHTKGSMRTFCDPLPYIWRVLCACASALMAGVFALWSSHAFAAP